MKYALFLLLFAFNAQAIERPDTWLCTSQGISRTGNVIDACGVGQGMNEASARLKALDSAMDEFTTICKASADCDIKNVSVRPKRMSCSVTADGDWKCYRLVEILIGK